MTTPATFVAKAIINGKEVSFFTPPHNEQDFLWVDIEELVKAFMPRSEAKRIVKLSQAPFKGKRMVATARNGDRIATIGCHAVAQGVCGLIDHINGHDNSPDDGMDGPAYMEYCIASANVGNEHKPKSFEEIFTAFHNNGGPFTRHLND